MKTGKKALFVCLFLFTWINVNRVLGQSHFAIAPVIGIIHGSVTANNYFDIPAVRDKGYGPLLGVMGHYFVTPKWSISTGMNYHRINYRRTTPNENLYKSNHWNIPVLINYKIIDRALSPYFSAGGVLSSRSVYLDLAIARPKFATAFDLTIGAGVIYKPTSRVGWIIQPLWQKEVAPKPNNAILPRYNASKVSLQVQMLVQL
ncbi:outer membrane beta-barrel protein [Runella sp. CRIBMP]|uniref:outer membrane beta-barrel protein n=1 Tax=Runella sp. CRIBMP TaxID=2683261 RepID=UPI001412D71B|nr:outer membrane beta-barrel protein [Runella sp. CRIBMP]NBB21386.1 outer membrane beta-barrel protein [Runella sp. CRIBMP]